MHKWLDNFGLDATYKCLLEIFVMAKHTEGAKALCRVLKNRGEISYSRCKHLHLTNCPSPWLGVYSTSFQAFAGGGGGEVDVEGGTFG